jgi:hypothetical protein
MTSRQELSGAGQGETSGAARGTCPNPAHASGPQDACAGCYEQAEAEATALRDRLMRRYEFERQWERDVAAMLSAKYRQEADLLAWTSLGTMDSLLSPLRAIVERAARIDPGMAYARHRPLFAEFQAAARYDVDRFREEALQAREDAALLWQAYTAENRQLRGILGNLAGDLHAAHVRACGKQPGKCRCAGCELAAAVALVPATLDKDGLPDTASGNWFGHVTVTFNDRAPAKDPYSGVTVRGIPVEDQWPPGGAMIKVHGAGVDDRYAGVIYPGPDGSWTADLWAETWTIPVEPQAGTCRRRVGLASRDDAEEYVREVLASDGPWYLAVPSSASAGRRPG